MITLGTSSPVQLTLITWLWRHVNERVYNEPIKLIQPVAMFTAMRGTSVFATC